MCRFETILPSQTSHYGVAIEVSPGSDLISKRCLNALYVLIAHRVSSMIKSRLPVGPGLVISITLCTFICASMAKTCLPSFLTRVHGNQRCRYLVTVSQNILMSLPLAILFSSADFIGKAFLDSGFRDVYKCQICCQRQFQCVDMHSRLHPAPLIRRISVDFLQYRF